MTDIVERLDRWYIITGDRLQLDAKDEIKRLRAESEAAGKLADSLSDEIERLKHICGDLQQILVDERAHVEALETEIGEYRAEISGLETHLQTAHDMHEAEIKRLTRA